MEVLFITHKYPPSIGGMEKQSYELINGAAKSCKVHTLIYDNRSSKVRFLLSIRRRVKEILKKNPGISLIHFNDGLMAFFGLTVKKITALPLLVTLHGLDIVFPSRLFQRIVVGKFKKLDGVIAVSQATARECITRGFERDRVYVVRNGVDIDMSLINKQPLFLKTLEKKLGVPLKDKKILVSVGRSVRRKGFSWFMTRVLPRLDESIIYLIIGPTDPNIKRTGFILNHLIPKRLSDLIILLFGLGIDELEVQKALEKPDIRDRAFYLGKQPFEDMVQILKHADMFVMPNIKVEGDAEGFGLVALEASVNGTPVIASAIEGITCAVLDGKNGFLVPAENESAWIDRIQGLLSDRDHLRDFGERAKQYTISNYAWTKMVDGYLRIFRKYFQTRTISDDAHRSAGTPAPGTAGQYGDVCIQKNA
ncbi:MAG: glycosyltransferase family 1 protein [Chrysiogenales bacterium]|nr:MAG: glycosyltransferase family 1 protein [Chrysiogenales bacterium]